MYEYKATITEVYDGDTVTAVVDLGFNVQMDIKVRLYGINAPELEKTTKTQGLVSRDRLRELVLGKEVIIKTYKDKKEKYGRWLGELFLINHSAKSVNTMLVEEGLASKYLL
jgi:micrococcal nuclease